MEGTENQKVAIIHLAIHSVTYHVVAVEEVDEQHILTKLLKMQYFSR